MTANLTPEYKAAEAAFRQARDPKERLECLRAMLSAMPKHKGTDHLQADIKSRIKQLTEELAGPRKGGARGGPVTVIHPEGAAQIALLGPPNSGKSSLHDRLTHSHAPVGPFPFTTQFPQPGMLPFEDIHLQLVDLPPITVEHPLPWLANALQSADGCLLVVDLKDPDCVERTLELQDQLRGRHITLAPGWGDDADRLGGDGDLPDPFALRLPTLLIAAKADLLEDPAGELEVFRELAGLRHPALILSAETGEGLAALGPWLFGHLGIVRVYTKAPGRPPDHDRPFTVRRGQTVQDVAELIHKDIATAFKYARVWGEGHFDGQQVGRDHPVRDGDVLEIHT